jgi:CubicO group peptidase (beta-lactamase class C family)
MERSPGKEHPMPLSLVLAAALVAAAGPLEDGIDAVVKKAGVHDDTPGVAVLVIQHGKVLFKKGYGLANLKERTPIRVETTFELASMSKTFTGTAICMLHDQGKLKFDDPVRKYISELPEHDKKNPLRISHLLHHTSGLPDYTRWDEPKGRHPKYVDNEDYVHLIAEKPKRVKPRFKPGDKYEYSNTNYLLLAVIAARITKRSFGEFMDEEIFKPVGMKHTWIYERPGSHRKHPTLGDVNALGYEKDEKGAWDASWGAPPFRDETMLTCGDGSVWTSIEDLIQWDGAVRGGRLVKPETWKEALTPSKTHDGKTNEYGCGWGLELDGKGRVTAFRHNGSWGGFRTKYTRNLEKDRTIIVLSNRGDFKTDEVCNAIASVVEKAEAKK